ncbi:MAG: hypothetical protein WCJ37_10295 [Syntrophus sp. (in: bacteria)]
MTSPFDEAKYRALLEGLEAVEIRLSDVLKHNEVLRVDSEYFQKADLILLRRLEFLKSRRIGDFSYVTDGIHESIVFSEDSKINLISAKCPKENVFDLDSSLYISEAQHKANTRTSLNIRDIVLSTVGTIGNCAVVDASILPANTDRHVGIIRIEEDFHPYVLSTFLLSRYGRFQTKRETTGNVQPNLFLVKIRELLIPPFSIDFQETIERTVIAAHQILSLSKSLHKKAEQKLLRTLGLEAWQPPEALTYVRKSSDVFAAGRFDAEHFQEKYFAVRHALKDAGALHFILLDEILTTLTNGHTPLHHDLSTGEVPFLCAEHINDFEISYETEKRILLTHHNTELLQTSLKEGDVLMTIKGKVGNAALVEDISGPVNINQDVALLRLNDKLPLWYVLAFVNSTFGNMLSKQLSTGGINPFLGLGNVRLLEIPVFDEKVMYEIAGETRNSVHSARHARTQARNLLERAKRAVEIAIEENETVAMEFLKQSQGITK